MNPLIAAALLSLAPISELRGGLPFALAQGVPWLLAFVVCVVANIAVIPFVFLFLDCLHCRLLKLAFYQKGFNIYLKRLRKRKAAVEAAVQSWGMLGLTAFVALPLPVTGAWTGTLIAWLLGLQRLKSFAAIAAGVLIAGAIVSAATLGLIRLL